MAPIAVALVAAQMHGQSGKTVATGLTWNVRGTWHVDGAPAAIRSGEAIAPGALLEATPEASAHSITVLLPDGQSVLYECFTATDCARGFKVPTLFPGTTGFPVEMLARIRGALTQAHSGVPAPQSGMAKDEAVAVLGPNHRIEVGGLAGKLSDGQYFGDLKSFDGAHPEQSHIPLEKSAHSITLAVPGTGLYLLGIRDQRNWPRVEVMIAVVEARDTSTASDFKRARELFKTWKDEFFGWPTHDFLRAYLEALMLHIPPAPVTRAHAGAAGQSAGVTAEPAFDPRPGYVAGNLSIALHCATPGATIHYSIDGAQPLPSSPVYRAPIVMTKLPMTIKAFAAAPGKKDSPVVTGSFRVQDDQ